jgi:CubicO group peptidase (beta-lactamase class C family)
MLPFALLLPLALAASDSASKPKVAPPPRTIPELEARITHVLDSAKVPGLGLAIVRHDSVIYTGAFGKARLEPALKATDRTLFRIGSTSKAFVALTAMALVQEGKLSLDDKLADRLPELKFTNKWEATDPIRIKHLLEHTSGFDDNSLMAYAINEPQMSLAEGLKRDSLTHVSRWRPGTRMSYCNTGPGIVARIIETIEGKSFEQVVQERWFTPIGMSTATYLYPDTTKVPMVTLYLGTPPKAQQYWHVFARPAGSINASAHDMAAYVRFLLGRGTVDGKVLLPAAALERMEHHASGNVARAGLTPGYGLHLWRAADSTGFTWTQHNGGVNGGLSDMSYIPELGVGYAFQINNGDGAALRLVTQAVRGYLLQGLTPPRPELPVAKVDPATRAAFEGWYQPVSPRMQVLAGVERVAGVMHVTFTDSGLVMKPLLGGGHAYLAVDATHFRRPGEREATLAFVRDSANDRPIGIEDVAGGIPTSGARVSGAQVAFQSATAAAGLGGLLLGALAMLWGGGRRLMARLRKRPASRPAFATGWRWVALLTALAALWGFALTRASENLFVLGSANAFTVGAWLAGMAFAIVSVVALPLGWRGRDATGAWAAVSGWTLRLVLLANVVMAGFLSATGVIGWRSWAG